LTWAEAAGGIVSSLGDMTTWDRDLYQGRLLPARQQHQLESLVSQTTGRPILRTTLSDPTGYGLGVAQEASGQNNFWYYEGQAFGARVLQMYFPRPDPIIALAVSSSTDNDHLSDLAGSVYQTLQEAGAEDVPVPVELRRRSRGITLPATSDRAGRVGSQRARELVGAEQFCH
jgi:D-alanyl-D-alanine carboxypeptidase